MSESQVDVEAMSATLFSNFRWKVDNNANTTHQVVFETPSGTWRSLHVLVDNDPRRKGIWVVKMSTPFVRPSPVYRGTVARVEEIGHSQPEIRDPPQQGLVTSYRTTEEILSLYPTAEEILTPKGSEVFKEFAECMYVSFTHLHVIMLIVYLGL